MTEQHQQPPDRAHARTMGVLKAGFVSNLIQNVTSMKNGYFTFILFLSVPADLAAQVAFPVNQQTKEIEFVNIVQIDSSSKKDNFNRSKLWVVNVFKSANDVIQYENPDDGKIICKGFVEVNSTGMGMSGTIHKKQAGRIWFTLELASKDDKCRIRIYDLRHLAEYSGGKINSPKPECGTMFMTVKTWNSIQQQAVDKANIMMEDFEAIMKQKKSDEW